MAHLLNCEVCDRKISNEAEFCPGCGHPRRVSRSTINSVCSVCSNSIELKRREWSGGDIVHIKYSTSIGEVMCAGCSGRGTIDVDEHYFNFENCTHCDARGVVRCPKCYGTGKS